jgi:hypothetical protein
MTRRALSSTLMVLAAILAAVVLILGVMVAVS